MPSAIVRTEPLFERLPARGKRRFREVVVFVHTYGTNRHTFHRQIELINELGFDAVTFDLPASQATELARYPLSREWKFGLRHIWADKIEDVLGAIADEKFIFSFSSGSMAALMALHRRHAIDVKGWICDGGPFKKIQKAVENLVNAGLFTVSVLGRDLVVQNPLFKYPAFRHSVALFAAEILGRAHYSEDADRALQALPQAFPILSLQALNDKIVLPDMIDEFFVAGFGHLDLQKAVLYQAHHLTGMKDDIAAYKTFVEGFLLTHAKVV